MYITTCPCTQVFEQRTMDLHGLHVSEAIEVLDTEMAALAERGQYSVRILTGTGHHSKGPTNKVLLLLLCCCCCYSYCCCCCYCCYCCSCYCCCCDAAAAMMLLLLLVYRAVLTL